MSEETKNDLSAANESPPTFMAHIVNTPNQDINSKYQTTNYRLVVDKRTLKETYGSYYDDWYPFSGVLTSMVVDGEKHDISHDFKIDICISSKPNGEYHSGYTAYINKLQYILANIRLHSEIEFKGIPRRVCESRKLQPIEFTDIENAHEIYIDEECIDTIKVKPPTRETAKKQNQYAQSRAKERSKRGKLPLSFKSKRAWNNILESRKKSKILGVTGFLGIVVLWKYWKGIIEYVTENPILVIVSLLISIIGGIIVHFLFKN